MTKAIEPTGRYAHGDSVAKRLRLCVFYISFMKCKRLMHEVNSSRTRQVLICRSLTYFHIQNEILTSKRVKHFHKNNHNLLQQNQKKLQHRKSFRYKINPYIIWPQCLVNNLTKINRVSKAGCFEGSTLGKAINNEPILVSE